MAEGTMASADVVVSDDRGVVQLVEHVDVVPLDIFRRLRLLYFLTVQADGDVGTFTGSIGTLADEATGVDVAHIGRIVMDPNSTEVDTGVASSSSGKSGENTFLCS